MGRQHAFGQAGGTRGVEDHRRVIGTDGRHRRILQRLGQQVLQTLAVLVTGLVGIHAHHNRRQTLFTQVIFEQLQTGLVAQ